MTREELYNDALKGIKEKKNLAITAATGVGKSKMAIDIMKELKPKRVLLVVAERAHIDNWKAEFTKWDYKEPVTIVCYASYRNYKDETFDLIIYDEAHHLSSDLRLDILSKIKATYNILLSATLSPQFITCLQLIIGEIYRAKFTLQEAFDANIIAKPKIFLIPLKLDFFTKDQTIVIHRGSTTCFNKIQCDYIDRWKYLKNKYLYPNLELTIKCTLKEKYDYLNENVEYYKKIYMSTRSKIYQNKWLRFGSQRKLLLGLSKTSEAYKVINKVKNKRFICFCANIEQAEILGSTNCIHSKKKNSFDIIRKFNNKQISNLYAVGMLQEGVNLTDIDAGIIVQLDGNERSFIQRFGRTLRSDSPEQYILYYKGTRDEEYLKNALEGIDPKYIKTYEICN